MAWSIREDSGGFPLRWSEEFARQWLQSGYWQGETLADIARQQVESDATSTLLIEGDVKHSRKAVYDSALRLVAFFQSKGAQPGDVVAFQLPNWSEAAIIALAARMYGLVITPLPPIYRQSELAYMLSETRATFLFIPSEFRHFDYVEMADSLSGTLADLREVVVIRGDAGKYLPWQDALSLEPIADLPKVDPAAVFMVMFTSGTTGRPKGVLQTHYGFAYKARQMIDAWGVSTQDVIFMPSPVTHITGAIWAFDIPWISGAPAVLLDVWEVSDGIEAIRRHQCTICGGATPFLQQLLAAGKNDRNALSSLRTFFCGGTSVSPELIKQVSAEFPSCLFFRAYGSTEMMTVTLGINSREQAELGAETDGIVLPPIQVMILDDEGKAITEEGVEGEIIALGPEQFAGYLNPEDNASAFTDDGFFRMGDLGKWSNGNFLVITGRKKDIIIRSGENISPKEVEDILMKHPAIADIAIVAMPSDMTGEKACAFLILNQDHSFDFSTMSAFLDGAGLARQKYPEWLEFVDDFPRVPSGKVRKDVLRARAKEIAKQQHATGLVSSI
jgi:acyl-CoA synthetase (AMP-forming)/AMP-acid ligase II